MPVLLRFTIGALSMAYLSAGAVAVALLVALEHRGFAAVLGASTALTALSLPAMVAGLLAGYWTFDDEARRRFRWILIVLVAVQITGAGVLLAIRGAAVDSLVVAVVGLALTPLDVLLGRAARRSEVATPHVPGSDQDLLTAIRRGWRRAAFGAAIGLGAGGVVAGLVLASADSGDSGDPDLVRLLVLVLGACPTVGASVGLSTVLIGTARRVRDLLGGDYSSARRIGRAIAGKPQELTDDERERAARFAVLMPRWQALQLAGSGLTTLVSIFVLANVLLGHSDEWVAGVVLGVLLVASVVTILVVRTVLIRRYRTYAAAHPVGAP